ncbi:MAG TPA: hypothetical protein VLM41_06880 [Steroidobacteraceae bacterium]|nr:hypothetical protein [Steroidobacteraceae bacterium]
MLQPDEKLPEVARHPAPWDLQGRGWVMALKLPADSPARDAFLPEELAGRGRALASLLMFVDYRSSPCGPYRELLFIPGAFPFGDGRRHFTISRILVSTWESVANGRRNWGIPKDQADFEIQYGTAPAAIDRFRVTSEGRQLCALELRVLRGMPRLPVPGALVPQRLRTLAQRYRGQDYYYAPQANGWVRPGRLLSWQFDGELFPDLRAAAVIAALRVEDFRMRFPVARIG